MKIRDVLDEIAKHQQSLSDGAGAVLVSQLSAKCVGRQLSTGTAPAASEFIVRLDRIRSRMSRAPESDHQERHEIAAELELLLFDFKRSIS